MLSSRLSRRAQPGLAQEGADTVEFCSATFCGSKEGYRPRLSRARRRRTSPPPRIAQMGPTSAIVARIGTLEVERSAVGC